MSTGVRLDNIIPLLLLAQEMQAESSTYHLHTAHKLHYALALVQCKSLGPLAAHLAIEMRLPEFSPRSAAVTFLVLALLTLRLRSSSRSPTAILLEEAVSSQIQHGLPLEFGTAASFDGSNHEQEGGEVHSIPNPHVRLLVDCSATFIAPIQHVRLPHRHLNISFAPPGQKAIPYLRLFNPTFLPLPSWSQSGTYLMVSRVVTEGLHQESLICLADLCLPTNSTSRYPPGTRPCTAEDHRLLGPLGGLRCTTEPAKLNIPPTPALKCREPWSAFPDIPGFHDPRIFWSGKGEPLIIANSASQYACVGLWITDLRTLYPELEKLVNRHGKHSGSTMSYHHLTEITRNPRNSRAWVEKNWMFWFPGNDGEAYVQYDLGRASTRLLTPTRRSSNQTGISDDTSTNSTVISGSTLTHMISSDTLLRRTATGRTFAKLIGNGFTTPNLTSHQEPGCLDEFHHFDTLGKMGHWHQGSNALRLILCTRAQVRAGDCGAAAEWNADGREVHFAIMHRKFANQWKLPMRYERFVAVWEGRKPFKMLGMSQFPILMENEWAQPWSEEQNWPGRSSRKGNWTAGLGSTRGSLGARSNAYFSYTPSLAWAWRPRTDHSVAPEGGHVGKEDASVHHLSQLGTGYLGDDVLVGIGLDDVEQVFTRVKVDELVGCLRLCPSVTVW